jgi:hypothetical protein
MSDIIDRIDRLPIACLVVTQDNFDRSFRGIMGEKQVSYIKINRLEFVNLYDTQINRLFILIDIMKKVNDSEIFDGYMIGIYRDHTKKFIYIIWSEDESKSESIRLCHPKTIDVYLSLVCCHKSALILWNNHNYVIPHFRSEYINVQRDGILATFSIKEIIKYSIYDYQGHLINYVALTPDFRMRHSNEEDIIVLLEKTAEKRFNIFVYAMGLGFLRRTIYDGYSGLQNECRWISDFFNPDKNQTDIINGSKKLNDEQKKFLFSLLTPTPTPTPNPIPFTF